MPQATAELSFEKKQFGLRSKSSESDIAVFVPAGKYGTEPALTPVRPPALKFLITFMQAYMPYESLEGLLNQPNGPKVSP